MKTSGRILLLLLGSMAVLPSLCLSHGETQQKASYHLRPWCLRGEARWWFLRNPWLVARCVFSDPEIKRCNRRTLRKVPGCVHSVFQSYAHAKVSLSPQCCHAVHLMSEDCFTKVFVNSFPLHHDFGPSVKKFCALANGGAPLPAPM